MGKAAISITLDRDLIDVLKREAKAENRNISNYIEVIINEKLSQRNEEVKLEQSFEKAKQFAKEFAVEDYSSVMAQLSKNTTLTPKGQTCWASSRTSRRPR